MDRDLERLGFDEKGLGRDLERPCRGMKRKVSMKGEMG
jgi:hypothetical protein